MSSQAYDQEYGGDLIDLHVGSPQLPRASICSDVLPETCDSDNLLDSELQILEEKLQTANCISISSDSLNNIVDVEDILIAIDDDVPSVSHQQPIQRSNSVILLDLCEPLNECSRSLSCDNIEAINVLMKLDDILNASLLESNKILNDERDDVVQTDQSIEDCLMELDNYLREYDISSSDDLQEISSETNLSKCFDDQPSTRNSSMVSLREVSDLGVAGADDFQGDLKGLEDRLCHLVESGVYVNEAYENTEQNKCPSEVYLRKPLSVCGVSADALNRNHPRRATTLALVRRERPVVVPEMKRQRRHSLKDSDIQYPTYDRMSGTGGGDSDEDIDWSWVQDVARDVTLERRAHAANDCCTGTVIVEPLRGAVTDSNSASSNSQVAEDAAAMTDFLKNDRRSSWLRSSMRRLRHFRLPSDATPSNTDNVNVQINNVAMDASITQTTQLNNTMTVVRPVSAPSRLPPGSVTNLEQPSERSRSRSRDSVVTRETEVRARSSSASSRSRRPRSLSSSESSLASSVDSTPSCTPAPTPTRNNQESNNSTNVRRSCERGRQNDMPEAESPLGQWPHSLSSMLACLGCTLGLFNISRFAILTIHFGANFIFQFFFLSMVVGLPLFTLQLCLGQQLGAGVIDMWRISPLFQGVGVSLLFAQALIGLYSIIGVSWMFVFFRDSFITKVDRYRWAEPFIYYREDIQLPVNGTYKITETVPDYFSGVVLQRHHLASGNAYGTIKFQLAFNLAVVWMIVFVSLSKGLRSYGKVIYVFTLLPVFGTFVLCAKILGMMPPEFVNIIFPETSWNEFFLNPKSWLAASQEVFLTWGLLGAAVMQIASHNKHKHLLQRDSSLVAVITFTILLLVAFLANTCVQILRSYGYSYLPNSFERISTLQFLRSSKDPLPPSLASTPIRYMVHNSFILGDRVTRPGIDHTTESGFQVLRLATELVPATLAVLGPEQVSPFWAVLFYFILILFGIAQQLAIWHCVITGIMAIRAKVLKSWETTITFFSCVCGFILGLPMATELGIYIVYFFDFTIGGSWWLILIILLQIVAVFMVRGRPYSGDTVVTALFTSSNHPCLLSWAPALLSFTWNVILPVALMVMCIAFFKNGNFREIFVWHHAPSADYWPLWARQIGSMIQLLPILCIPIVAVIQSYRYLNNGPSDILERIQLLYRPPIGEHMEDLTIQEAAATTLNNTTIPATTVPAEDPPPKYTPPPSYTTATGARIAKFLRQSIRRSVRRIANVLGESSNVRQANLQHVQVQPPPPDYNAVLVEMNQTSNSTNEHVTINLSDSVNETSRMSTSERRTQELANAATSTLTAADVASILRSSFRRSTIRAANTFRGSMLHDNCVNSLSAENLVDSAAPIGETSLVLDNLPNTYNEDEIKTSDNLSSVI